MLKTAYASILAVTAAFSTAAFADGLPSKYSASEPAYAPVNIWAGYYFGGNAGYGENRASTDITSNLSGVTFATGPGFESKGAFGGAQAGYNWQRDRLVFGVETDLQFAGIHSAKDTGTDAVVLTRHMEQDVNWFGTFRGRLGYTFNNTLVYATGGLAYAGIDSKIISSLASSIPVAHFGRTDVETGFTVGGGVEWKVTPVWSVKADYQFIDLGSTTLTGTSVLGPVVTNELDNSFHTFRIGFNYHLDSGLGYMPLK